MDPRRSISKRTREALFTYAQGRSQISGEPLTDWQVDHLVPHAAGGSDDITNLQALTRTENQVKSDAMPPPLWKWQKRFIDKWNLSKESSFLLVALPGSGKTIAALTAAREWQYENPVRRRILVVVPTDPLRTQWKDAAVQFGLNFQTKEFKDLRDLKTGMVGGVITYQLLPGHDLFWKLMCRDYDVLAILDEVHHASDNNIWGGALKEALEGAKRRLLTSGTPFRGDALRIPFVQYGPPGSDGMAPCVPDFPYDYPDAIRDGVIRVVRFQHETGDVHHVDGTGVTVTQSLSSELEADEQVNLTLRRILTPGSYTETLLRLGHQRLLEVRAQGMTNAAGLVICKDQNHAERIAAQLHRVIGHAPDLIISDDDRATSTIEDFRKSTRMWVVAVKKISEGVDIPRLLVLTYLTHCKTALFFRQAVGRIVRNLGTEYDSEAFAVIPDHPLLVRHARQIIDAQYDAIMNDPDDQSDDPAGGSGGRQPVLGFDVLVDTEHTGTAGTIIEGQSFDPALAARIAEAARRAGCTDAIAARLYREFGMPVGESGSSAPSAVARPGRQRSLEDQLDDQRRALRKVINKVVTRVLPKEPHGFKKGQRVANRHVGKWQRREFTLEDLARAMTYVRTEAFIEALRREP